MDGLEILDTFSNEELEPLVQIILEKGSATEMLSSNEDYKRYHPDHHKYVSVIKQELLDFGSNTFWSQEDYRTLLKDVCKKMDAGCGDESLEEMEQSLLAQVFGKSWEKLSEDDRDAVLQTLDARDAAALRKEKGATAVAAFIVRQGGFKSYQWAVIIANSLAKQVMGQGLKFATNAALTQALHIFAGPIGWVLTAWSILDIAGPAYRVTIPAVCYIASMRQVLYGGK